MDNVQCIMDNFCEPSVNYPLSIIHCQLTSRLPGFLGTSPPPVKAEAALDKAFCSAGLPPRVSISYI